MRTSSLLVTSSLLAVAAACGGARAPAASPPPAPRSGQMEHGMENCPSAVPGARTIVRDVAGGVTLDITAPSPDGEAWIREVATVHARMGAPTGEHVEHTGEHGGPGTTGHCPIVHVGTQVTVVPLDGGVRVTVLAVGATSVDALRGETRARAVELDPAEPVTTP
jgi:hypothetical protein